MIDASHINVKLKPIFGIEPEKYILPIYGAILFIIIFALLVLPGILKYGTYITFTSTPIGASIYIDDKRVGSTPDTVFVHGGSREIKLVKENFTTTTEEVNVKGRVFFSLLFKKKSNLHFKLDSTYSDDILSNGYNELSKWSLNPKQNIRFKTPAYLSTSVIEYLNSSNPDISKLEEFLSSSRKLITREEILSDFLRALAVKNSQSKAFTISSLKESLIDIDDYLKESPNLELFIYSRILNEDSSNKRYDELIKRSKKLIDSSVTSYESSISNRRVNNYTYKYIPKGRFTPLASTNFIHEIREDSFYISDRMVTREDWDAFVKDNPKWSRDNIDSLMEENLVDREYLESDREEYITNISYYGAIEWIKWANNRYNIPRGFSLALPTESQWLSAQNYGVLDNIEAWSWSSQGFYLYDHFLADIDGQFIKEFDHIEPRLVLGRNKYNKDSIDKRGVQKANWCSPFLGIRPVLLKDE